MTKKILCAAAVSALAGCAAAFGGCYDAGTFVSESKSYSGEEVSSLSVEVTDREVEVVPSAGGDISIEYFSSEKEYYDITLEGGELKIELVLDKEWSDFIGTQPDMEYRKIKVSVPQTLSSIEIFTTNEDIIFGSVEAAKSVNLNSNGGNVQVDGAAAGESISLTSKNGNISGSVSGTYGDYTISCTIKKGNSNLVSSAGGDKQLNLDCNNGDINIQFKG